ncbi:hypothetical protein [Moraxella oblonga]|uniref:hypothetical protein n=1 Tax=Moraxella oblonga TaxID=200413 RepID=UPI0012EEB623|nr:hypothetical protein [Moraxella oblonga]
MKSSQNNNANFTKTLMTLVAMVVISGLVWLGIRQLQTDVKPVAKPVPKTVPHE